MARSSLLALGCCVWLCGACEGAFVNLGSSDAELAGGAAGSVTGGAPTSGWDVSSQPLLEQQDGVLLASPSLTRRGELFFSSQERGSQGAGDPHPGEPHPVGIVRARPRGGAFSEAVRLSFADGEARDIASPAVSPDGTELWFGLNVAGHATDIFRSVLQGDVLGVPELVGELASVFDDVPRPPALSGTLMPISSKRHGDSHYRIYFAQRPSADAAWGAPSQELLQAVNVPGVQTADGFINEDGLELYFSSGPSSNDSDLYLSRRAALTADFGAPEPLSDLNTDADERMPWLSPDGSRLYFVSNRATEQFEQYALYVASKR